MGDLIQISKLSFNNLTTTSNPERQGDSDPNLNFFVSNDYNIIKTNKSAFISRLYQTVEDPRCNTLQWDSEGKSFLITDYDRFEKYTLPNCFNNSSVTSFIRQLNLYGFKRTSDGRKLRGTAPNNFSSFAHQNFVQGQPHLIAKIKRQPRASKRGVFLLYPNEPTNTTPPTTTKPPPSMYPQIETETLTLPSSLRTTQMQSSLVMQPKDKSPRVRPETWVNDTRKNYTFQTSSPSSEGGIIYSQPPPTKIDHLLSYNNDKPVPSSSRPFSFVPEAEIEQLTMTGRYRLQPPSFPLPEYLNPPTSTSQNRISSSISNILNPDDPTTSQRHQNRNHQNNNRTYCEDYYPRN